MLPPLRSISRLKMSHVPSFDHKILQRYLSLPVVRLPCARRLPRLPRGAAAGRRAAQRQSCRNATHPPSFTRRRRHRRCRRRRLFLHRLPFPAAQTSIQLEYVWQGGLSALDLRCKTRTWTSPKPPTLEELPIWNFDGSSTGQAPGHDSEVLLKPVRIFPDPFRGLPHLLVLAECIDPKHNPIPTNTRAAANALFESKLSEKPWWGAWRAGEVEGLRARARARALDRSTARPGLALRHSASAQVPPLPNAARPRRPGAGVHAV